VEKKTLYKYTGEYYRDNLMAGVNQIITKGISLVTKYADDAARVASTAGDDVVRAVTTAGDDVARYVKACGKRSILETKPLRCKIKPKELGVIFPDGQINFQNEECALKYIQTRLVDSVNRPKAKQFERVIAKKGAIIIGESDGVQENASNAFLQIKGMADRGYSSVERDIEVFHSHPDVFGIGETTPLSAPDNGDLSSFFYSKLKKIVAVNSKGEFNSIEATDNLTEENFQLFKEGFKKLIYERAYGKKLLEELKTAQTRIQECGLKGDFEQLEIETENIQKILSKMQGIGRRFFLTEEYAQMAHEYYKKAGGYGMIYSTNFSNLA